MAKRKINLKENELQTDAVASDIDATQEVVYSQNKHLNRLIKIVKESEDQILVGYIPMIAFPEPRYGLDLPDYIILLTILSRNLEGKFFCEKNEFFTAFWGISTSQIEKSISKLLEKELIAYVDNKGEPDEGSGLNGRSERPLTTKQAKKAYEQDIKDGYEKPGYYPANDKREFIAKPFDGIGGHVAWQKEIYYLSDEDKKERRQERKLKEQLTKTYNLLAIGFPNKHKISLDIVKNMQDKEYRESNIDLWNKIESALTEREVPLSGFITWLEENKA